MKDVKDLTAIVVLAVYVALLLALLRPGSVGQNLVTESGLALAGAIV